MSNIETLKPLLEALEEFRPDISPFPLSHVAQICDMCSESEVIGHLASSSTFIDAATNLLVGMNEPQEILSVLELLCMVCEYNEEFVSKVLDFNIVGCLLNIVGQPVYENIEMIEAIRSACKLFMVLLRSHAAKLIRTVVKLDSTSDVKQNPTVTEALGHGLVELWKNVLDCRKSEDISSKHANQLMIACCDLTTSFLWFCCYLRAGEQEIRQVITCSELFPSLVQTFLKDISEVNKYCTEREESDELLPDSYNEAIIWCYNFCRLFSLLVYDDLSTSEMFLAECQANIPSSNTPTNIFIQLAVSMVSIQFGSSPGYIIELALQRNILTLLASLHYNADLEAQLLDAVHQYQLASHMTGTNVIHWRKMYKSFFMCISGALEDSWNIEQVCTSLRQLTDMVTEESSGLTVGMLCELASHQPGFWRVLVACMSNVDAEIMSSALDLFYAFFAGIKIRGSLPTYSPYEDTRVSLLIQLFVQHDGLSALVGCVDDCEVQIIVNALQAISLMFSSSAWQQSTVDDEESVMVAEMYSLLSLFRGPDVFAVLYKTGIFRIIMQIFESYCSNSNDTALDLLVPASTALTHIYTQVQFLATQESGKQEELFDVDGLKALLNTLEKLKSQVLEEKKTVQLDAYGDAMETICSAITNIVYRNPTLQNQFRILGGFSCCLTLLDMGEEVYPQSDTKSWSWIKIDDVSQCRVTLGRNPSLLIAILNLLVNVVDACPPNQDMFTESKLRNHLVALVQSGADLKIEQNKLTSSVAVFECVGLSCLVLSHISLNHIANQRTYSLNGVLTGILTCAGLDLFTLSHYKSQNQTPTAARHMNQISKTWKEEQPFDQEQDAITEEEDVASLVHGIVKKGGDSSSIGVVPLPVHGLNIETQSDVRIDSRQGLLLQCKNCVLNAMLALVNLSYQNEHMKKLFSQHTLSFVNAFKPLRIAVQSTEGLFQTYSYDICKTTVCCIGNLLPNNKTNIDKFCDLDGVRTLIPFLTDIDDESLTSAVFHAFVILDEAGLHSLVKLIGKLWCELTSEETRKEQNMKRMAAHLSILNGLLCILPTGTESFLQVFPIETSLLHIWKGTCQMVNNYFCANDNEFEPAMEVHSMDILDQIGNILLNLVADIPSNSSASDHLLNSIVMFIDIMKTVEVRTGPEYVMANGGMLHLWNMRIRASLFGVVSHLLNSQSKNHMKVLKLESISQSVLNDCICDKTQQLLEEDREAAIHLLFLIVIPCFDENTDEVLCSLPACFGKNILPLFDYLADHSNQMIRDKASLAKTKMMKII